VRERNGSFRGFRMKLVQDHKPLHELYAPGPRKHNFPQADYKFLVRTAANLARAAADVHQSGCVIGDVNHSGALISAKATVSLIDADSFQFSLGSQTFRCAVGVPEYTPPELQGVSLGSIDRTPNHDCFGLAVLFFQLLLMGRHPFVGTVRRGEIPPLNEAIRDFRFVYTEGRNVGMDQPPGTPALSDFPGSIGQYFESAFGKGTRDRRPPAADWVRALDALEASLVQCNQSRLHFYPGDADECPWCYMERELRTVLFVPFVPGAKIIEGVDFAAAAFNIDSVWRLISAVSVPPRSEILPKTSRTSPPVGLSPMEKVFARISPVRIACAAGALALLLAAPTAWPLYLGLGLFAIFRGRWAGESQSRLLRLRFEDVEKKWYSEVIVWQKRAGVEDLLLLQQRLQIARDEYVGLELRKRAEIETYRDHRRERQLQAFLDNFQINNSTIKGIGSAKQAALSSYGIDTAADITLLKALAVPGIGPALAADLVSWRTKCERRFIYSETLNQTDAQEISNIDSKCISRAAELRRTLSAGPANMSALAQRVRSAQEFDDPAISKLDAERQSLRQKLKDLGLTPPDIVFEWPKVAVPVSPVPPAPASPPSAKFRFPISPAQTSLGAARSRQPAPTRPAATNNSPLCPRCSSPMVLRVARRGRNVGGSFWGCSRFPVCRGTRSK
jgi:DNA-binding helix-hairpin-helix protein with protein kinase domain